MSTENACYYALTEPLAQELNKWMRYFNDFLPQLKAIGEPIKLFHETSDLSYNNIIDVKS